MISFCRSQKTRWEEKSVGEWPLTVRLSVASVHVQNRKTNCNSINYSIPPTYSIQSPKGQFNNHVLIDLKMKSVCRTTLFPTWTLSPDSYRLDNYYCTTENDNNYKILSDSEIQTHPLIPARKQDQVLINKMRAGAISRLMDFTVPADHSVKIIESEKIEKYSDVARELNRQWKVGSGDYNCSWCEWNGPQRIWKGIVTVGNQRNPPVKAHQQTLIRKT